MNENPAIRNKKGDFQVYTDNSHYEKIDKKERKKVYSKIKAQNDAQFGSCEEAKVSKNAPLNLVTWGDRKLPEAPTEEMALKLRDKNDAKSKRKVYTFKGNINREFNPVEVPETFEFSARELSEHIVKGEGKNKLYNPHSTYLEKGPFKDTKDKIRSRRKRQQEHIVKASLGKVGDFRPAKSDV